MEEQEFTEEYKNDLFENFYSSLPIGFQSEEIRSQLRSVYDFAYAAHYGVRRKGGNHDPYISHPVAVAAITANEIGLGVAAVLAALLHDVVEDTEFTHDDIEKRFGKTVANIVDGLTKITNVYDAKQNAQANTFKKMLLGIPHDPRVAFVKIADRLHNMRTIEDMPDGTRQIKAGENLYVYVPLADQLVLYDINNDLEDLSFKYVNPVAYKEITYYVDSTVEVRNELMAHFKLDLMRVLVKTSHTCKLSVITKSLFQTWSVMQNTGKSFSEINNYQAVRIVFKHDTEDPNEIIQMHYQIYASVISNFPEKSGSKRDYVISPKKNGFKALVFQVMYGGNWMEVQILTTEDDLVAHRGYSHSYPTRTGLDALKNDLIKLDSNGDAVDLINRFRSLATASTILVFTPKGDIIELPSGATVLDFAFAIHDKMGQHCLAAVIEHKVVPINYELKTTDQVAVLTSPSVKPHPEWMGFVTSDKAKQWLENHFKQNTEKLKSEAVRGKQMFNNLLAQNRMLADSNVMQKLNLQYKLIDSQELYQKISRGEITLDELLESVKRIKQIIDGLRRKRRTDGEDKIPLIVEIDYKKPLLITNDIAHILAPCCCPIPGDNALACTDDEGIVFIHRKECINAKKLAATRGKQTTKVLWGDDLDPVYAPITIQGSDRPGMLLDIATLLCNSDINVKSVNLEVNDGIFDGSIGVMVKNAAILDDIISKLAKIVVMVSRRNSDSLRI